ncbi:MAG: hypothetical protein JWM53_6486 [bacterium]|nr:hypothetical protein [bacterium]
MGAIRAFGSHNVTRRPDTDKRVAVWLAMRQLVRFDVPTLVMTTDSAKATVQDFVRKLNRVGYLRRQREKGVRPGCNFIYQLVRNTGPKPPITRKKKGYVYDQNERKCYAPGGAVVPCKGESDADTA